MKRGFESRNKNSSRKSRRAMKTMKGTLLFLSSLLRFFLLSFSLFQKNIEKTKEVTNFRRRRRRKKTTILFHFTFTKFILCVSLLFLLFRSFYVFLSISFMLLKCFWVYKCIESEQCCICSRVGCSRDVCMREI